MNRIRPIGLALVAMFAFSAFAASAASAQAPYYRVNGKTLKAGESRLLLASAKEKFVLKATGVGITVTCQTLTLPEANQMHIEGAAAGSGAVSTEVIEYGTCTQEGNGAGCAVTGGKVKTAAVWNLLGWGNAKETGQILVLFEPVSGKNFTTLSFTGETCIFLTTPVEGTVVGAAQVGGAPLLAGQNIETLHGEVKFPHIQLIFTLNNFTLRHTVAKLTSFGVGSTLAGVALLTVDEGGSAVKWGVFS